MKIELSKQQLINLAVIAGLCLVCLFSIKTCCNYKDKTNTANHNIAALNDTVKYYTTKNGSLVASKLLLEGDLDDMKTLNEDLYNEVKELKAKGVKTAIVYEAIASAPEVDTCWIVTEAEKQNLKKDFSFNDEYRTLEGNVTLNNDTLGMEVTKDEMKLDYTVVVDKDSRVHIKTDNPYVKVNEISGFTVPKQKKKRWGVGPQAGYGFDLQRQKFAPYIGIGIQYNIFQF